MALLAAGVGIGRLFFVGTISPSVMPAATAGVLYDQIIELVRSTIVAGLVLGILTAIIAWCAGPFRPARALRGFSTSVFGAIRRAAARYGVTTGAFGVALDRYRAIVYVAIALIASAIVVLARPMTTSMVVTTVVVALIVLLLVELLRRPADEVAAEDAAAAEAEAAYEAEDAGASVDPSDETDAASEVVRAE